MREWRSTNSRLHGWPQAIDYVGGLIPHVTIPHHQWVQQSYCITYSVQFTVHTLKSLCVICSVDCTVYSAQYGSVCTSCSVNSAYFVFGVYKVSAVRLLHTGAAAKPLQNIGVPARAATGNVQVQQRGLYYTSCAVEYLLLHLHLPSGSVWLVSSPVCTFWFATDLWEKKRLVGVVSIPASQPYDPCK